MSGSTKHEQVDKTDTLDFLMEQADRILAWETIHTVLALDKQLPPSRIATAIGVDTEVVYSIIDRINDKFYTPDVL